MHRLVAGGFGLAVGPMQIFSRGEIAPWNVLALVALLATMPLILPAPRCPIRKQDDGAA